MNATLFTNNGLGCPGCNSKCGCSQPAAQPVGALPGVPDLAEVGKKAVAAVVLVAFAYIAYKTFSS